MLKATNVFSEVSSTKNTRLMYMMTPMKIDSESEIVEYIVNVKNVYDLHHPNAQ